MKRLDRSFRSLLRHQDFAGLEAHGSAVFGVWQDFRLAYMNPAWFVFAGDNLGEPDITVKWGLGSSFLDCMQGEVKARFREKLSDCLENETVWSHQFECSSDTLYRRYHQIVYPLPERGGLLFVNSLIIESPHGPDRMTSETVDESDYLDDNGFICQCAYCRRVKYYYAPERWDWVPGWVRRCPEHTSHTFCPVCYGHYFRLEAVPRQ